MKFPSCSFSIQGQEGTFLLNKEPHEEGQHLVTMQDSVLRSFLFPAQAMIQAGPTTFSKPLMEAPGTAGQLLHQEGPAKERFHGGPGAGFLISSWE